MKEIKITQAEYDKIVAEHEYYVHTRRPEVVQALVDAKSYGDLSENAEYDAAREEQALVEGKIKEFEAILANAIIIQTPGQTDVVELGNTVTYENTTTGEVSKYLISGQTGNPLDEEQPSISSNTPIARGLSGKRVGDVVEIDVPNGTVNLKVIDINVK